MTDVIIQGKKFKPSNRPSSDVKVGDWVKIFCPYGASIWRWEAMKMIGNVYKVESVAKISEYIHVECGYSFAFGYHEFTIVEEIPEQTKIPRNHPHADMIRQWLDDASLEVEYSDKVSEYWRDCTNPRWHVNVLYRFKPKTVPAWQVLYEFEGEIELTSVHYTTEEDFTSSYGRQNQKFIKFVLETEKLVQE